MFDFWKARKARKLAVDGISPFMGQTRQRFGEIPGSVWSNAYVIGFVSTLITLFAERNVGELGASALASVQAGAWTDITHTESTLVGENICFLSTAGDRAFELGCCNAALFYREKEAAEARRAESLLDDRESRAAFGTLDDEIESRLWINYFDAYLTGAVPPAFEGRQDLSAHNRSGIA